MADRRGLPIRSTRGRYGFAVLTVAIAVVMVLGWMEVFQSPAIAPFLAAILLTGWYAGGVPVVLATGLSVLAYTVLIPPHLFELSWPLVARLVWFLAFACLAAWFGAARRRAAEQLEAARNELEDRVAARTAELHRTQEYLLAAEQVSHTGSWVWRLATGERILSQELIRMTGHDLGATSPSRERVGELWHPSERDEARRVIDAAVRGKQPFERAGRIVRPDGSIRFIRALGRPVLDAGGEVVEYIGVVVDVTDRKRAARRLRRAREQAATARFVAMLDERTRLARELHDTLLQGFTAVGLNLVAVTKRVHGSPEIVAALRDVIAQAEATLSNARRAIWDMRPQPSPGGELPGTLRAAAEAGVRGTGIRLEVAVEGLPQPAGPDIETAIFRVAGEAIANAVNHSAARTVTMALAYEPREIRLSVTDDGRGFVVDPVFRGYGGHIGLLGMQERAGQAGGTLSVQSAPGSGTAIVLRVPYGAP